MKFKDFDGSLSSFYRFSPHNLFCEAAPLGTAYFGFQDATAPCIYLSSYIFHLLSQPIMLNLRRHLQYCLLYGISVSPAHLRTRTKSPQLVLTHALSLHTLVRHCVRHHSPNRSVFGNVRHRSPVRALSLAPLGGVAGRERGGGGRRGGGGSFLCRRDRASPSR